MHWIATFARQDMVIGAMVNAAAHAGFLRENSAILRFFRRESALQKSR